MVFHADDWGLTPAINDGILALARRGRLRSASCMATERFLEHGLDELLSFADVKLYLHLNLTYGPRFHGHQQLLFRSALGRIPPEWIQDEMNTQLDRLEQTGVRVHGVNGHHHVHLLPGVFDGVIAQMERRSIRQLLVADDRDHLMSWMQMRMFLARRPAFLSVRLERCLYLRPRHLSSKERLLRKVAQARERGLSLLVHPALHDDFAMSGMTDSLRGQRVVELQSIIGVC